jgi:hypothetical protein
MIDEAAVNVAIIHREVHNHLAHATVFKGQRAEREPVTGDALL